MALTEINSLDDIKAERERIQREERLAIQSLKTQISLGRKKLFGYGISGLVLGAASVFSVQYLQRGNDAIGHHAVQSAKQVRSVSKSSSRLEKERKVHRAINGVFKLISPIVLNRISGEAIERLEDPIQRWLAHQWENFKIIKAKDMSTQD